MNSETFPDLTEFLFTEEASLDFPAASLSESDMVLLDSALRGARFPAHAERQEAGFDLAAAAQRMQAASARFMSAIILIEDSFKTMKAAAESIERCQELPALRETAKRAAARLKDRDDLSMVVELLVRELHQQLRLLMQALDLSSWNRREALLGRSGGGALWLDQTFAARLKAFGPTGAKLAEKLLPKAQQRWAAYVSCEDGMDRLRAEQNLWRIWQSGGHTDMPVIRAVEGLARVLLHDVVEPHIKERAKASHPALSLVVSREVASSLMRPGVELREQQDAVALVDDAGAVIGSVPLLGVQELGLLEKGFSAFAHLTGHRLFRWLVQEGHRRAFSGEPNPSVIVVEGGLKKLAHNIGAKANAARTDLFAILRAGQDVRRQWPGGEAGGLWTYVVDDRSAPGRPSVVEIRLGYMLMPYFGMRRLPSDEQVLVPMVPLPPFVPRERDHAAQAAFQVELVMALVDQRVDVVRLGGADLPEEKLKRLAAQVGLPEPARRRVIGRWLEGGDDGPAFLERVGKDIYNLADNNVFGSARRFLLKTGELSQAQSRRARGRRSATRARR